MKETLQGREGPPAPPMPPEDLRQKLLPRFRETTADRVEKITGALLALERGQIDADGREELERELHTLKGESRMMGFTGISAVVHAAEEVVRSLPSGGGGPRLSGLLEAVDAILPLLSAPPDGGEPARELAARLWALAGGGSAREGEKPPLRRADDPKAELRGDRPPSSIRIDVDRLDEIAALSGDVLVEGARSIRRSKELSSLFARWARLSDRVIALSERLRDPRNRQLAEQIEGDVHLLRSDTFRFTRAQSEAASTAHAQFGQLAERIGAARLIPLSGVLAGFPRAARDMAREQGKEVLCLVMGAETGVDKAILLSLNDPLVHLVRNSLDHGIELPEERERAGKPREGKVTITAKTDGDLLALSVEDDGRGIDPAVIRATALRRGVVADQQAAGMSARALMDLLFLPGFSTREEPGETSGRGVGLDVVRRKVTSLGGSVSVESRPGKGACFTLRMPQSLSLMKVLLVKIDEDIYGLSASDVDSVGRLDPSDTTEVAGIRAVRYRDRLLPVVALGPLLNLNQGPSVKKPLAAYLWHGSEGAAVLVDGVWGEREVAVKAPGAFLSGMRFLTGAAALEDGRVALLLSTPDLVAAARRATAPSVSGARERRRLRILLVDDSAIAREAEAALLRSLGHEVEEALDGEEGLARLEAAPYHLLITDVKMPRMDGIELTRRVKATPRFSRLPVVILSSLSAPEERRRGVEAGADAYLFKGDLGAESLAATLERLCGVPA